MSHVHGGGPDLPLEPFQLVPGGVAQLGVEVGEGLIEEKDLGIPHEGATEGDALALPARELARITVEVAGDAEHIGRPPDLLRDLGARHPDRLEGKGDVLSDGPVGVEGVALEDHRDPPGPGRHVPVHALARDEDLARRGTLQPRDHAEQGRLAAAGGAEQDEQLALTDREVHAVDRVVVPEVLSEAPDVDARHDANAGASLGGPRRCRVWAAERAASRDSPVESR